MTDIWVENGRWCKVARCGHVTSHSDKYGAQQSLQKNRLCVPCVRLPQNNGMFGKENPFKGKKHTEETKDIMRKKAFARVYTPEQLARFRLHLSKVTNSRPLYDIWLEKYGEEEAELRLAALKVKQSANSSGANNPMYGKPSPNGAGNGWKGWYENRFFRSLRELSFMVANPEYVSAETAHWSAQYTDHEGTPRTTRPDFVCDVAKKVVECKPLKLHSSPLVMLKARAMEELCGSRGYEYKLVDPPLISKQEIVALLDRGVVKFVGDYEERVRNWNG